MRMHARNAHPRISLHPRALCYPQVASWGGYSFIANLLPIHCLACIVFGRVSSRLYIAYAPWVILGALAAGAQRCTWQAGLGVLPRPAACTLAHAQAGWRCIQRCCSAAALPLVSLLPCLSSPHAPHCHATHPLFCRAANIPVIGFNAVLMSEHMASFFVFGLLHAALALEYVREMLPPRAYVGTWASCARARVPGARAAFPPLRVR